MVVTLKSLLFVDQVGFMAVRSETHTYTHTDVQRDTHIYTHFIYI